MRLETYPASRALEPESASSALLPRCFRYHPSRAVAPALDDSSRWKATLRQLKTALWVLPRSEAP
eukprot:scaffold7358_cov252-Pinguiococcus_pyrenoidosus.AAC.1